MSYSNIVGTISGVLQFAVACYALRVSRVYGLLRVGWLFFGAFSTLSVVHVLLSVRPFGIGLELGPAVNVFYEIISVLLLGTIFQMELLLWKHRQQQRAELQARIEEEAKGKEQIEQLTKANEELKQNQASLQAETAQKLQAFDQNREQAEKLFEEELNTARQSESALRETLAKLEAEFAGQNQAFEQALGERERTFHEQLAALSQSEEQWRATATVLQTESAQHKLALERVEQTYREQLSALSQSESELRAIVASMPAAEVPLPTLAAEPVRNEPQVPQAAPAPLPETNGHPAAPLAILRQSGIVEVAAMTQSRVAYIARIAKVLRDHARDLGKFMTRNPQGKRLPASLLLLIEYLSDEQFLLVRRIDSLKKKLEQLKAGGPVPVDSVPAPDTAESNFESAVQAPLEPAVEPPVEPEPVLDPAQEAMRDLAGELLRPADPGRAEPASTARDIGTDLVLGNPEALTPDEGGAIFNPGHRSV